MADNISITSGTGVTVATDDDGSAQHQWVKIEIGDNGSFVPVTTANGLPVQILSLPALGAAIVSLSAGQIISVSGLTSATVSIGAGSIVSISGLTSAITSLSSGTIVSISGLTSAITSLSPGGIVSISGLTSAIVSISNLPISVNVESLPPLGAGTVSISPISLFCTVTAASVFRITSLPALGFGGLVSISDGSILSISNGTIVSISGGTIVSISPSSVISISGLTSAVVSLSAGSAVTISNLASVPITMSGTTIALVPHTNYFYFSSTYTAALTTGTELKALSGSTSAYVITDIHFSCGNTHGNMSLVYSRSNAAIVTLIPATYFANYAGMVSNLGTPLVCDTNSAIHLYSQTCTSQSVMISGYTI